MFSQTTSTQEITILPLEGNVQVRKRTTVSNDGEVVSTKDHYQLYSSSDAEAVAIIQDHNAQGITDALAATAAKATAEAALATANTEHTAALAAKQTEMDTALASAQAELAAKDAEIARLTALVPAPVIVSGVPQTVTMRQARLALLASGLLDDVTAAVAGAGQAAQIEWEYSDVVARNAALVQVLSGALGLTDEQLDGLFVVAATL